MAGDLGAYQAQQERAVMEAFRMPPEMLDPLKGRVRVILDMPQKSRKRPITDDMVQMCADLKIEPRLSFADAMKQANKALHHYTGALLNALIQARSFDDVTSQFSSSNFLSFDLMGDYATESPDSGYPPVVRRPPTDLRWDVRRYRR